MSDEFARFEADIITELYVDSTSIGVMAAKDERDEARLRTFREAARRPVATAYHLTYVDSGGGVSVILSPPSTSAATSARTSSFLRWDKIAQVRLTSGAARPEITMRDGTVISAEVPSDINSAISTSRQRKSSPSQASKFAISDTQLRALLHQFLRLKPNSPAERRSAAARDSMQIAHNLTRHWSRMDDRVEVLARQELRRPSRAGVPSQRVVISVRNAVVAGSTARLTGKE